jgi:hypothetical protein
MVPAALHAEDDRGGGSDIAETRLAFGGWAGFLGGQFVKYKYDGVEYSRLPRVNATGRFNISAKPSANLTVNFKIGARLAFSSIPTSQILLGNAIPLSGVTGFGFPEADMVYALNRETFFNVPDNVFSGEAALGFFPFKYNPEATNLGEYLFRTGTYPGTIITDFDDPYAYIGGLRLGGMLFGFWKNDLLLTPEMNWQPFFDLTGTWITSVALGRVLDVGGGVSFCRFLSANERSTTPHGAISTNVSLKRNQADMQFLGVDANNNPIMDTTFYTFRGTKLMSRFTFNTCNLLPGGIAGFLGKNAFRLYGEMAVLGIADQGVNRDTLIYYTGTPQTAADSTSMPHVQLQSQAWYTDLRERIPMMFGVDLPTHPLLTYPLMLPAMGYGLTDKGPGGSRSQKIKNGLVYGGIGIASGALMWALQKKLNFNGAFDVVSFEMEYFESPYPNDNGYQTKTRNAGIPIPSLGSGATPDYNAESSGVYSSRTENWKWSLYAVKSLGRNVSIIGLAGRDHTRAELFQLSERLDTEEILTAGYHWHWAIKAMTSF